MHPPVDTYDLESELQRAASLLRRATRVAVLTGSGVSAESGISTFRGQGGLWEGHPLEDVATPMGFQRDPELVWRFYNARRAAIQAIQPNPGHHALAEMEQRWGPPRFTLATQNVDRLHQAAGSQNVLELHGNLVSVRCTGCGQLEDRPNEALPELPHCDQCDALLRPNVVWFYEQLPETPWRAAIEAVAQCQCLLVVGTSAVVYPAAGLIDMAHEIGATVIEVNLEPTSAGRGQAVGLYGPSGVLLPQLLRLLDEDSEGGLFTQ